MADKLQLRMWQQIAQAKATEYAGTPEAEQYLCESRRYALAADRIEELERKVAHLSLYAPAQRAERTLEPVKAIWPTNFAFYGIVETDEDFLSTG